MGGIGSAKTFAVNGRGVNEYATKRRPPARRRGKTHRNAPNPTDKNMQKGVPNLYETVDAAGLQFQVRRGVAGDQRAPTREREAPGASTN